MGRFGATQVDVKANLVVLDVEADHSSVGEEVGSFSHGENGHSTEALQDCSLAPDFVAAEEEDVAALYLLRLAYQANMEYPDSDTFPINGGLKLLPARLVVEDAEIQSRIAAVQDTCRPIDELREVEEKRSFHLVLFRSGLGCGRLRQPRNQQNDTPEYE
jgi:hypothetical protein